MIIRVATAAFMAAALLSAAPSAWSAPPEGVGGKGKPGHQTGKSGGQGQGNDHGGAHGSDSSVSLTISVSDRTAVRDYYRAQFKQGFCPPGLAKKNNGCLPPGQEKKLWAVGQPLPPHLVLEDLPANLRVKLSVPPEGYKYVRAAADILLIATGTSMVVGAIEDLGQR